VQYKRKLAFVALCCTIVFFSTASEKNISAQQALVVYSSYVKDNMDIFIMDVTSGIQINLTNNPANDIEPEFSPDGKKIVFASDRTGNYEIYTMDLDGKNLLNLTRGSTGTSPSWSSDGKMIAFDAHGIWVMDADGNNQRRITKEGFEGNYSPSMSPDGQKVVYYSRRDGSLNLYIIDVNGENERKLTDSIFGDEFPSWSPDGKKIAFDSGRNGGNAEIFIMDADGSNPHNISDNPAKDMEPAWSDDGEMIVFVSSRVYSEDIYIMRADGSGQTRLTYNQQEDRSPDWFGLSVTSVRPLGKATTTWGWLKYNK